MAQGQHGYPDIPFFRHWNEPSRAEVDIRDLEVVEGEIPPALHGTLYRNGPEFQYQPRVLGTGTERIMPDQFLNGEGMVHRFRFEGGHVDYRSRYVRNERFLAQEAARRSLFGRYRNRYTDDPLTAGIDSTTSNAHVVWHGGRLMALEEDGLPHELDPITLKTWGKVDYDGAVTAASLSAHPKIDVPTDELRTFSYQAGGEGTTDMAYYRIGHAGTVLSQVWFNAPYAAMVHDFAIAGDYVVFPFFPLITDLQVVEAGGPFFQWHPDETTYFAVMPYDGGAEDIRWFSGPAVHATHVMNAFVEDGRIHVDMDTSEKGFVAFPDRNGSQPEPLGDPPRLARFTLDLDGDGTFSMRYLTPEVVGPGVARCDDRFQGQPYRHGYSLVYTKGDDVGIVHTDHQDGTTQVWDPGEHSGCMEPVFVPAHREAAEGEGYLLTTVNRKRQKLTSLVVLDARHVDRGPIAVVGLPVRIRLTFHGIWVDDADFAAGTAYHRPSGLGSAPRRVFSARCPR
jgi:carotenoid cleavage dioxygenase-like enzyme